MVMKKRLVIAILIIVIALFGLYYTLKKDNSASLGKVIEKNKSFSVSKVVFKGDDGKDIYGLFYAPYKDSFDVVIVLPAGGGTKESRRFYNEMLADWGYGSFIFDQRGIGETDGYINSLQDDFQAFFRKERVDQFLMAEDVVNAVDEVEKAGNIGKIAVIGESMGGRNAIIAGALDKRILGVIAISSGGYRADAGSAEGNEFLSYINPNSYAGKISPRRLLMLHAVNDSIVSIEDARYTFSLAGEPKQFVEFSEKECNHGYCEPMKKFIKDEISIIFEGDS